MPTLTLDVVTYVAAAAAALALVSVLVAVGAQLRLARVRRALRLLRGDGPDADVLELAARHAAQVAALTDEVERLGAELVRAREDLAASLRHVALVRYDAFGDMGGRMSFSAAVVDDAGDGLVITAIHGRGESRSYAKGLVAGASDLPLSPEEQQAVEAARTGERRLVEDAPGREPAPAGRR